MSISKNTSRVMINIDNDLLAQIDKKLQMVQKSGGQRTNHRVLKSKYKKRRS